MSNSPLATVIMLSPNCNSPRNKPIDRITIHCFVGQVTAKRGCEVFQPTTRQASCNYVVGFDGQIGLCVEEKNRSWCSSSGANDHRAITIEVASETKDPYVVNDAAYAALLDLCTDICQRNGKTKLLWFGDKDKTLAYTPAADEMVLTVHRWFANKACPGKFLYDRQGEIATEVTKRLAPAPEPEKPAKTGRYNAISEMPSYAQPTIRKMVDMGLMGGTGTGKKDADGRPADLDLSMDMIRVFVTNDRAGLYGD